MTHRTRRSPNSKKRSADEVHQKFLETLRERGDCDDFFATPSPDDFVLEGAGCWHPTFPARDFEVSMLAGTFVAQVEHHLGSGSGKGLAVLAKCGFEDSAGTVEIVARDEI